MSYIMSGDQKTRVHRHHIATVLLGIVRYRADTILSTDVQTDKVKPVHPLQRTITYHSVAITVVVTQQNI